MLNKKYKKHGKYKELYKELYFFCLFIVICSGYIFAQTSESQSDNDETVTLSPSAQLALSTPDYRVTAGDVYILAYLIGNNPVEYTIIVDSTYRIRVANLGVINASGKTFNQLRTEVEAIVLNNYPLGAPQFTLRQPSTFKVYIQGEVQNSSEISAWALSRVASVLESHLTPFSSIRNVSIRSANGQARTYDLFRAHRFGDLSQNPYLRPDDVITINRADRRITVSGEVERPGTYQLLAGENLRRLIELYAGGITHIADTSRISLTRHVGSAEISGDIIMLSENDIANDFVLHDMDTISIPDISEFRPAVPVNRVERTITISGEVRRPGTYELMPHENLKKLLEVYGDGFTPLADTTRIELIRLVESDTRSGDKILLSEEDLMGDFILHHFDTIVVPSITAMRPVIFVEGAVVNSDDETPSLERTTRLVIPFIRGETYGTLIRRNREWFTAVSDTANAYIIRGEKYITINLNPILFDETIQNEQIIMENDTLIIPFRQHFITVAGAVYAPGRYPYIPDRNWEYYIALAGGFIPGRNTRNSINIVDLNGIRLNKNSVITPETIITANTNHFLFYWNQYAPVITAFLSIVSTTLSIWMIVGR